MTRFAVRNLVAQADADRLLTLLRDEGYAIREADTSGVSTRTELWQRLGDALGFDDVAGWDSLEDHLATALLPDDDEGDQVAFVWHHAGDLQRADLDAFLETVDILVATSRQATTMELGLVSFLLGDSDDFPPLADD